MLGLPGPTLRDEDVRLFKDTRAAGLILYRRNFDSPAGLLRLVGSLEGALGRRLLVATDHEGGRVVMLGATTIFPDNLAVGTAGVSGLGDHRGRPGARGRLRPRAAPDHTPAPAPAARGYPPHRRPPVFRQGP